jgi:pimeloyl-ACP methyl ester carboxylesterase
VLPSSWISVGRVARTVSTSRAAGPARDTLDRLSGIQAPTLVVGGEQDLLTPPWQVKAVADEIPGARYEPITGPGSSQGLHIERPDDLVKIVTDFIDENTARRRCSAS